jgi:hypothetical protein
MTLHPKRTAGEGRFVINLCSVDTPITLPQPHSPELMRFKFFLSHRMEANRRRYTLHLGHFSTLTEAQKWLTILRGVYPNAFVSDGSLAAEDASSDTLVRSSN